MMFFPPQRHREHGGGVEREFLENRRLPILQKTIIFSVLCASVVRKMIYAFSYFNSILSS